MQLVSKGLSKQIFISKLSKISNLTTTKALRELRDTIQRIYIKAHSFNRQANAKQGKRLQGKYTMGLFYHSGHAGASIWSGLSVKTVRFNVNSLYCISQFPYKDEGRWLPYALCGDGRISNQSSNQPTGFAVDQSINQCFQMVAHIFLL